MTLDQQLRADLENAVKGVPSRHGSLESVVAAGSRRRTVSRGVQLAAAAFVLVALGAGSAALFGRSSADVAGPAVPSTIGIGGFDVAVDGLAAGFEDKQLYHAKPGPTPIFPTDQYGPQQSLELASPPELGLRAVGERSIYLGEYPLLPGSAFLYTDAEGLACIWLERQPEEPGYEWCLNSSYSHAGALSWMIEPASVDPADGATIVVAWYGLPPQTSVVTATVDAEPVGWQRVNSGAVVFVVQVDLGTDLVLTALDAAGEMIDFGRDETGSLIFGEQRFDNLTFDGIVE